MVGLMGWMNLPEPELPLLRIRMIRVEEVRESLLPLAPFSHWPSPVKASNNGENWGGEVFFYWECCKFSNCGQRTHLFEHHRDDSFAS
jgi:hypothetical protein